MAEEAPKKQRRKRPGNRRRNLMKSGQKVGKLTLVQRVRESRNEKKMGSPSTRKKWRVECECGTRLTIPEMYLRRENPKTSCGECGKSLRTVYNNEYRIWLMIRERTRNPEHVAHAHYKSRGIDICEEWHDLATGFELFLQHVGARPSKDHSVDRIDNRRGYEPGNVRWATAAEQRANQDDCVGGLTLDEISKRGLSVSQWIEQVRSESVYVAIIDPK